jgi:hypothetical protein
VTKVPPVIDVAYVSAVMVAINHVHGEAARRVLAVNGVDADVRKSLAAIYTSEEYDGEISNFEKDALAGVSGIYAHPPGDPVTTVRSVISSSSKCVVADATTDLGPFFQRPIQPLTGTVIQLGLKAQTTDPSHLNPTPWLVEVDGRPKQNSDLSRACKS